MKYIKNIGIPLLFLVLYFCLGGLFLLVCNDAILVTIISDLIVGGLGFIYYQKRFKTTSMPVTTSSICLFCVSVVVLWFVSQITVTYVYMIFGDAAFDTYRSTIDFNLYLYFILTIFVAPFTEEVLMRGVLFLSLKRIAPIGVAYLISAFVFAGMHGTLVHMFIGILFGVFLAMMYEYTHRLRYCVLLHSLYNLLSLFGGGLTLPNWCFQLWFLIPLNLAVFAFLLIGCIRIHNLNKSRNLGHSDVSESMM